MKRLSFSLTCLPLANLAYAQTEGGLADPLSPSSSGTEGDGWLFLLVIPFIERKRPTSRL